VKTYKILHFTEDKNGYFVGRVCCVHCFRALDLVTQAEKEALETGRFGAVLCNACALFCCHTCGNASYSREHRQELRLAGYECVFCQWEKRGISVPFMLLHLYTISKYHIKETQANT